MNESFHINNSVDYHANIPYFSHQNNNNESIIDDFASQISEASDFYWKDDEHDANIFPIIMVVLTILTAFSYILALGLMVWKRMFRRSATHETLMHVFLFMFMLLFTVCLDSLSTILNENGIWHIRLNKFICAMSGPMPFALESCINFQFFVIWMVLMSERKLTGFDFLNNDFKLKKAVLKFKSTGMADVEASLPSGSTNNNQNQLLSGEMKILELRKNTWKNFLLVNSRTIALCIFYTITFGFALHISLRTFVIQPRWYYYIQTPPICWTVSGFVTNWIKLLSMPFFFIPFFYLCLTVPILFGKFFGGERDPINNELTESDKKHLMYVKIITSLKAIDIILLHVHPASYMYVSPIVFELILVFGMCFARHSYFIHGPRIYRFDSL
jgi:hypothetical protein